MKNMKIVEGIVGIIQKLGNITVGLVDKMKNITSIKIEIDKQEALEQVVDDVREELHILEKGIEGLELLEQEQVLEATDQVQEAEVSKVSDTATQHKGKRKRLMDNIVYFEAIPSVVKIKNADKEALLEEKVVDFKRLSKAKNKGSILPLHRCVNYILERGQAHQREPTWKSWKEM